MRHPLVVLIGAIGTVIVTGLHPLPLHADGRRQAVVIQCPGWCRAVAGSIRNMGGDVLFEYENVEAIAADVPESRLAEVSALVGARAVWKDVLFERPRPIASPGGRPEKGAAAVTVDAVAGQTVPEADLNRYLSALPADYNYNNTLIRAAALHAAGRIGNGIITAIIDSGTANSPVVPALTGTVIGGESLVAGDPPSATSRRNDPHGTQVGTVIAGHAAFVFANASRLVSSLQTHAPASVIPCPGPPFDPACPADASIVPMIGTAPGAKVYAIKVFGSTGGGAPNSRIIAAMDRAITLRRNFNHGMPSLPVAGDGSEDNPFVYNSLKIDVVNMSLGGPTLFAGRELDEQLTQAMLRVGITNVIAAGNDGLGAMTVGSPGDGFGALTAGAANSAVQERVLRDVQFGVGIGVLYRPTSHVQTAYFSSRGPTADGRFEPDMIANGFATFVQGTCEENAACLGGTGLAPISLVAGTSFSTPVIAGAAALLRREAPAVSATRLRNAIIESSDPALVGDQSGLIDQGLGFLDVTAALARLHGPGRISSRLDKSDPGESVRGNIQQIGLRPIRFVENQFSARVENLVPGQVAQFFVPTSLDTSRISLTLKNITPANLPATQNQLFGDDIFLNVNDAPTSFSRLRASLFLAADTTIIFDNVQPGLMRVSVQGDWTNAGTISADLVITRERRDPGDDTVDGRIAQGGLVAIPFVVRAGATSLGLMLSWEGDWGRYPTNDLDLLVQSPAGVVNQTGATLDSPERVSIANPAPGVWLAFVNGFTVHAGIDDDDHGEQRARKERWELRVDINGHRLRLHGPHGSHDKRKDKDR
jgi:hypothetical protein